MGIFILRARIWGASLGRANNLRRALAALIGARQGLGAPTDRWMEWMGDPLYLTPIYSTPSVTYVTVWEGTTTTSPPWIGTGTTSARTCVWRIRYSSSTCA